MATDTNELLRAGESLPSVVTDATLTYARSDKHGAQFSLNLGSPRMNMALEGTYWVAQSAVPGTTVAYGSGGTQATFSDTTAFIVVKNNNTSGSKIRTYLDYLRILVSGTVPASATSIQFAVKTDTGSRAPTAGSSAATAVTSVNTSAAALATQIYFPNAAVPTVPASVSARVVGRGSLRQSIPVTLDELVLKFGPDDIVSFAGTAAGHYLGRCAPVVLNPQEFAVVHLWLPSGATNPLTCEIEVAGWEK